jgi:hypothetical protein
MLDSVVRYLAELEVSKRLTLMSATLFWTGNVGIAFFLAAITTAQADVQIDRTFPFAIRIWITNTIKESDAKQLQEISAELEFAGHFDVWLDSKGGDVSAAIKIGKLMAVSIPMPSCHIDSLCLTPRAPYKGGIVSRSEMRRRIRSVAHSFGR